MARKITNKLISIIRLSAKGTDGVMKPIWVFRFLIFPDIVSFVRLAHYRTRGGEWRGGIAANPASLYVVGHPLGINEWRIP